MSALDELIREIVDENLRRRIEKEIATLKRSKKFGLVFEPQNPECTPLYDVPVRKKSLVALKAGKVNEVYRVMKIDGDNANCIRLADGEELTCNIDDLISVAQFGTPIYPYLQPIDSVCNAPESNLWHALIESDNYHALQLLKYLYGGKVDCIYIDPPYNTGARDWKYNNDYVDASNEYRHSKWLAMMERRLKLAKDILNPNDSVLIVTIDEHEYLHLGCLLEEIFRGANIQMITTVINPKGVARKEEFSKVEEYIFFIMFGDACPTDSFDNMLDEETQYDAKKFKGTTWLSLRRAGTNSSRKDRPKLFYPIYVEKNSGKIVGYGEYLSDDEHVADENVVSPGNVKIISVFPIKPNDGSEGRWQLQGSTVMQGVHEGTVKAEYNKTKRKWLIKYLNEGAKREIASGDLMICGKDDNGALILERTSSKLVSPKTVWNRKTHNATTFGTQILNAIIGGGKFSFPKSLYAVRDALKFFVANKPDALIVDFFAGSGTTLHAVNLLNAEDGGQRRCILVTNNEVSDAEEKNLRHAGYTPADEQWQKLGVARYVTWQRTVCSIEGHDINGSPLKGNYLGTEIPMADGFKANAAFFKLGFLDKDSVALGRQFKELLPVLWFKSGCRGACPTVDENLSPMMILPANNFAVLLDEKFFADFEREVLNHAEIDTIFIITDSEYGYRAMIKNFDDKTTSRLYRDYLENFRISG